MGNDQPTAARAGSDAGRLASWPLAKTVPPAGVSAEAWADWGWQMRHRIRSAEALREWIEPTSEEEEAIELLASRFRFVITPYYAS